MIRGFQKIVMCSQIEPGSFYYLREAQNSFLFLCIEIHDPNIKSNILKALVLQSDGHQEIQIRHLPADDCPLVHLEKLGIRVNPTSVSGSAFTKEIHRGDFLVRGSTPILVAPMAWRTGHAYVDLLAACLVSGNLGHEWLAFDEWWLVVDQPDGSESGFATFHGSAT